MVSKAEVISSNSPERFGLEALNLPVLQRIFPTGDIRSVINGRNEYNREHIGWQIRYANGDENILISINTRDGQVDISYLETMKYKLRESLKEIKELSYRVEDKSITFHHKDRDYSLKIPQFPV